MSKGPVRRAQLIAPFGVGAMTVVKDGTSLLTAGLDHWFEREDGKNALVDADEYVIQEWRLQRLLRVGHFRLPPDFRLPGGVGGAARKNVLLSVPALRFPQWHFCEWCRLLIEVPLAVHGVLPCPECEAAGRRRNVLRQVQFVAMCDQGHLQDFPWREWVHRSAAPTCRGVLRLRATGSASLAAQQVTCDGCRAQRTLAGVTSASGDETTLSQQLDGSGEAYRCRGARPWLGPNANEPCDRHLRGSLRGAGNVYYADVRSAIFLPREDATAAPARLLNLLDEPVYASVVRLMEEETTPAWLRHKHAVPLEPYTDAQIQAALAVILAGRADADDHDQPDQDAAAAEADFRRAEYRALCTARDDEDLVIVATDLSQYAPDLRRLFSRVMLVPKLKETRAFVGFSRILAEDGKSTGQRKRMLRRRGLRSRASWLPANVVFGEGIFLELEETALRAWEADPAVQARAAELDARYAALQGLKGLRPRAVRPRFLAVHTLAHLLINRLTFECGYSTASLRERLYVASGPDRPMAGILIYTAAGDADGTMGGLVRMGQPGNLEPVVRRAAEWAQWCSADPVCMETDAQGPLSLNMAACHSCALVPETACEEFNRFLDRGLTVGGPLCEVPGLLAVFGGGPVPAA